MYHQRLTLAEARWDWRVVKAELDEMYCNKELYPLIDDVHENLCKRIAKSDRALKSTNNTTWTNRRELVTFIELMNQVMDGE
jgi:hypothetical protein